MTSQVDGKIPLDIFLQQRFMSDCASRTGSKKPIINFNINYCQRQTSFSVSPVEDTSYVLVGNGTNKFVSYKFRFKISDLDNYFSIWFCDRFDVTQPEYIAYVKHGFDNSVVRKHIGNLHKHLNKLHVQSSYAAINNISKDIIAYFDSEIDYIRQRFEVSRRAYLDSFEKERDESTKSLSPEIKAEVTDMANHTHQGIPDGEITGIPIFRAKHKADLAKIKPWWKFWS